MKRGQENITDEELLKRYCESGDLAYFVEAYKRYMPLVYGVALKYLSDRKMRRMPLCNYSKN
ncbi:MAG: hypothetical protein V8R91_15400 [Butyricimonas faecihominis]